MGTTVSGLVGSAIVAGAALAVAAAVGKNRKKTA